MLRRLAAFAVLIINYVDSFGINRHFPRLYDIPSDTFNLKSTYNQTWINQLISFDNIIEGPTKTRPDHKALLNFS